MHPIYQLYQLMPGKDCGICGSISCRQFARRLAAGEEKAEKCTYLRGEGPAKVETLLKGGVETHRKLPHQEDMLVVQPCTSDSKKVMADGRMGKETKYGIVDTFEMCKLARKCTLFKKQKCSEKLGIATFVYGGREIVAYDNGRISVKQADSKEEAVKAMQEVGRILQGSFLCPECGGSAIDCAKGFCKCDMGCTMLPPAKERPETNLGKMNPEELENAGMELLAGEDLRSGISLLALAECTDTLSKCGTEEEERARNNMHCAERIKRRLKERQ